MTGPAILVMVAAILIIWGGLVGSVVALKILTPPYQKGINYEDMDMAMPHPGLSDEDFEEKE